MLHFKVEGRVTLAVSIATALRERGAGATSYIATGLAVSLARRYSRVVYVFSQTTSWSMSSHAPTVATCDNHTTLASIPAVFSEQGHCWSESPRSGRKLPPSRTCT